VSAIPLSRLGWARRILSAVVCVSALALVMAKTGTTAPGVERVGLLSACCFVVSLIALVEVARREHADAEHASAERERRQLALLKVQLELAKAKPRAVAAATSNAERDPG
jgi:hypothetical protein